MSKIYIQSVNLEHTTAQYFRRVFEQNRIDHAYVSDMLDISQLSIGDIFLAIDPVHNPPMGIENCPCHTIAYFIDVHQAIEMRRRQALLFDSVFVAQRDATDAFTFSPSNPATWLPLACDPQMHGQVSDKKIYDVGFVGKLGQIGSQRHSILTHVLPHFQTNDYERFVSPDEMGEIYGKSKIVLNASIGTELNMRFFEAMASGALLITDRIPDAIGGLFEENVHFIAYDGEKEAKEKVRYFLEHSGELENIAKAGQAEVIAKHTYMDRWSTIENMVTLGPGKAPVRSMNQRQRARAFADIFADLGQPNNVFASISRYGITSHGITQLAKAIGKKINSHIPITPNAIRYRLTATKQNGLRR